MITRLCVAGRSSSCRCSRLRSGNANAPLAQAGEWMRPTQGSLPVEVLYRTVDRDGNTIDFLLRTKRVHAAARRFLERSICLHAVPEKITIDKSGANTAAIQSIRADSSVDIEMCQSKYLDVIVEPGHWAIKRFVRPMLGFKSCRSAQALIAGIETMHLMKKRQLDGPHGQGSSTASKFCSLAL